MRAVVARDSPVGQSLSSLSQLLFSLSCILAQTAGERVLGPAGLPFMLHCAEARTCEPHTNVSTSTFSDFGYEAIYCRILVRRGHPYPYFAAT